MGKLRNGFTLVEVMVATMIVSIVIAALWKIRGDANIKMMQMQKLVKVTPMLTFLSGQNMRYGFDDEKVDSYKLLDDFQVRRSLRARLKYQKMIVHYNRVRDMELQEGQVIEMGESIVQLQGSDLKCKRVRWQ